MRGRITNCDPTGIASRSDDLDNVTSVRADARFISEVTSDIDREVH
jgi:hypothetical protein